MAKANSSPIARLEKQIDQLEKKQLILRSKCEVIMTGMQAVDEQIRQKKEELATLN